MAELRTHLFTIGVAGMPRRAILLCSGRMDPSRREALEEALSAAIDTEAPVVEIDLRQVSRFDSGAAAALLQVYRELSSQGRELRLVVNPQTDALLRGWGAEGMLSMRAPGDADGPRSPRPVENAE
jgi:anti-anti-sigma factor